jgi:gas vesicle protein
MLQDFFSGILGAILGGIIGGIATVLFTHHYPNWLRKRNNWVEIEKRRLHRLPEIPDFLKEFFPDNSLLADVHTKDVKIASGQSWSKLMPTQKEIFFQIYEWLGGNREDYEEQIRALLPKYTTFSSRQASIKR